MILITCLPNTVQIAFPESIDELNRYDVIVISDIGSNTFLLQNETFYQLKIKQTLWSPLKSTSKMAVDYS
ncbi:Protein of uncharacterised function (DUF1355) [Salmonella enterica subsp. enterica]|uniref:Protein of uncharacterized function (DUF1355) n=1 Tax=Salmonella enterica I TaxID=59201 RepID=A0A379W189_SALET|nr:Protein of uncharacterised function (DUF1355) [Salmonella enterica subsp. enterica]